MASGFCIGDYLFLLIVRRPSCWVFKCVVSWYHWPNEAATRVKAFYPVSYLVYSPCTSPPFQFGVYWVAKTLQQCLHTSPAHGPAIPIYLESFPQSLLISYLGPEQYFSKTTNFLNSKQETPASCVYGQARNSVLVLPPYPLASLPYLGPTGISSLDRFEFVFSFLQTFF